jgi:hypothetical protein
MAPLLEPLLEPGGRGGCVLSIAFRTRNRPGTIEFEIFAGASGYLPESTFPAIATVNPFQMIWSSKISPTMLKELCCVDLLTIELGVRLGSLSAGRRSAAAGGMWTSLTCEATSLLQSQERGFAFEDSYRE